MYLFEDFVKTTYEFRIVSNCCENREIKPSIQFSGVKADMFRGAFLYHQA